MLQIKTLIPHCKSNGKKKFQTVIQSENFGQAKFSQGGSVLGSSQFSLLPKLPLKMMLNLKVVKFD